MTKRISLVVAMCFFSVQDVRAQDSYFTDTNPDVVRYEVAEDVVYGTGMVLKGGKKIAKPLTMDVYSPKADKGADRPSVVLVYGGAHHRGNPRVKYVGFGSQTSSMSDYAMRFAEEGYVAFTIRYRVAPDNPVLSTFDGFSEESLDTKFLEDPEAIRQANVIRAQMGLEPLTAETSVPILKTAIIAGAEDLRAAIRHIKAEAKEYGVAPDKVALMGFSAGAVTAINVAYGMQEPVAAVVANSGYPSVFNMERLVKKDSKVPPALLFMAQNDYPVVEMELPPFMKLLTSMGLEYEFSWIPSHGHFYPSGVTTLGNDGSKMSLEARGLKFLRQTFNPSR